MSGRFPAYKPQQNTDVLVIGLGPAGASAMRAAAAEGLRVIGIERKAVVGQPVQCAEYVPQALRPYCTASGVIAQAITNLVSTLPSGEQVTLAMPGLIINRHSFDSNLVKRSMALGASCYTASQLLGLDAYRRTALIKTPAGMQLINYQYLIAADGPCSSVAKYLKLPTLQTIKTQQYTVPLLKPLADTYTWLSEDLPGGYAWLFPKQDCAHIGVGAAALSGIELKQCLQRLHNKLVARGLVDARVVIKTGGKIPVSGIRPVLTKDHVLFAGDAAGLSHPISGAGIAPAVFSGELAAEVVAEALRSNRAGASKVLPLVGYTQEIRQLYEPAYQHALNKRQQLLKQLQLSMPQDMLFRHTWIGFSDDYHKGRRDAVH